MSDILFAIILMIFRDRVLRIIFRTFGIIFAITTILTFVAWLVYIVGIAGLICSGIGLIFGAVYNVAIFASVIENISEGYYYY